MRKRNATALIVESLLDDKRPGAFKFTADQSGKIVGANFWCPCGCGSLLGVRFPPWNWNGDREKPTVRASIHHSTPGKCGWHGYLTAGEFKEC